MRYINLEGLEQHIPERWLVRAKAATKKLLDAPTAIERKKVLKNRTLWNDTALVAALKDYFHNKCWYTDTRELISDYHVDHYRPKNEVKGEDGAPLTDHEGYWWEAYNWRNYRLTGKRVNSPTTNDQQTDTQGKGSYFPLINESKRAKSNIDPLEDELPVILDPANPFDVLLITYGADGIPVPVVPEPEKDDALEPINRKRARLTIQYLNLDSPVLNEERKKIWRETKGLISRINDLTDRYDQTGSEVLRGQILSEISNLIAFYRRSDEEELGIVRRHCIRVESGNAITNLIACVA